MTNDTVGSGPSLDAPRRTALPAGRLLAAIVVAALWLVVARPAVAHSERTVGRFTLLVGQIGEPLLEGPRYGFELWLTEAGRRVGGADRTLRAEVSRAGVTELLTLAELEDSGHYEADYSARTEGLYDLRLFGTVEGDPVDATFPFWLIPPDRAVTESGSATASGAPVEPGVVAPAGLGFLLLAAFATGLVIAARRATPSRSADGQAEQPEEH